MKDVFRKTFLVMVVSSSVLQANIESDLKTFFDGMGVSSNVTRGGAYHDQTGGYYSGGSVFMRSPTRNPSLFQVTPPSLSMNCANMDLIAGGFSVLSSKQLMDVLHGIGRNATAYAFQLGLSVITPQVKSAIDQLMAVLQNVNGLSQNSCLTGQLLAAGLLPKNEAMTKHLCKSKGMSLKMMEDWAGLDQACGTKAADVAARDVPGYEDVLSGEYNVAWKALQKNDFLKGDKQLAHLMMSISGSLIARRVGEDRFQKSYLPSLLSHQGLLDALIYGGQDAEIYVCDDGEKCLHPRLQKVGISADRGLFGRVQSLLEGLSAKVRADEAISREEQAFVNATALPVMAILAVEVAFRSDGSPLKASAFAEAIAYDLLLRYFEGILDLLTENLRDLEQVQVDDAVIKDFKKDLRQAQQKLTEKRNGLYQQMLTHLKMIEQAQQIEHKLQHLFITTHSGDLP